MRMTDGVCDRCGTDISRVFSPPESSQAPVRLVKLFALLLAMSVVCGTLQAETHTVKWGESLWRIAKKRYGDGEKWRWIWAANRKKIRRPNHIRPGQRLKIPSSKPKTMPREVPPGYEYWKTIRAVVRAYCPRRCCCRGAHDGKTALMDDAWVMDGAAVAFSVIPRRTLMRIPGIGLKEADDTGPSPKRGARRGQYRIEVRMTSHWNARKWGKPWKSVILYRRAAKYVLGSGRIRKSPKS